MDVVRGNASLYNDYGIAAVSEKEGRKCIAQWETYFDHYAFCLIEQSMHIQKTCSVAVAGLCQYVCMGLITN